MNIPLFKIHWDDNDIEAVVSSLKRGMSWADGPTVEEFEKLIAQYIGRKYAVVFNSGTSALHALFMALGIGGGDEVIVPSFSFIATANAPLFVGANPVFADIEEDTYGLDVKEVEKKITEKTKAIMPMHYGGAVARDIKELRALADKHNIILIEDAAESFGAKLDNQKVGCFGHHAMFSFCQTKVFTTAEGGCIVTDSEEICNKLKLLRSHGKEKDEYVSLGYNFRMPDCLASLGISQLNKVDKLIEIRREKADYYDNNLSGDIIIPKFNCFHVRQEYHIRTKRRDELKQYLAEKGIGTRISFPLIHLTKFYQRADNLPIAEKIVSENISLPLYVDLTKQEQDYIIEEIKKFYE